MGVDLVHPVAIRRAEFWTLCSVSMCVLAKSGLQAMLAYEITGLMNCL